MELTFTWWWIAIAIFLLATYFEVRAAVQEIKKSTFSDKNKKILLEQADENRNLAVECAKKRNILRDRHRKERENLILQMKQQKENRKAVQDVMNIY